MRLGSVLQGSALARFLAELPLDGYVSVMPRLDQAAVTAALGAALPPLGPLVERVVAHGDREHLAALAANGFLTVKDVRQLRRRGVQAALPGHHSGGIELRPTPRSTGDLIETLRREDRDPVVDAALHPELTLDWTALAEAHRRTPFFQLVCGALLRHPDCPPGAIPVLLRGYRPSDGSRLFRVGLEQGMGAEERLMYIEPAHGRLSFVRGTLKPLPHRPWVRAETGDFSGLLALDLPSIAGDDPRAWLRMLRLVPEFPGTLLELAATAAVEAPVPPRPKWEILSQGRDPMPLLLFLAPPDVAAKVAPLLDLREQELLSDPETFPVHPEVRAALGVQPPEPRGTACPQLVSRTEALKGLAGPLVVDDGPDRHWVPSALFGGLVTGAELIATARPLPTAVKLLAYVRPDRPEVFAAGMAELRRAVGAVTDPQVWVVMASIVEEFPGTLREFVELATSAVA